MNPIDMALGLRPIEEALEEMEDAVEDSTTSTSTNLEPIDNVEGEIVLDVINLDDDETYQDIEQARMNIQNIIVNGDETLKTMVELAKQSESPRAYEVASTLMKTLLDANKDFVEMSMKKRYHREEILGPKEAAQTNVTNNNLIISTGELLKMMKGDS